MSLETEALGRVTLEDILEKIEYHRNEQELLMEQAQEHLPEGFELVQMKKY